MKNNLGLDFSKFEKIEDIIYIDEPILTHLKRNEKHFLLYLVDTVNSIDIYLLFEVTEKKIFEYLTKSISLKKLILENNNINFLIEQDFEGNIIKYEVVATELIDLNYLPSDESYLEYEPSRDSYYFNFIEETKSKSYLQSLRQNAFYLKFAPTNTKYLDTIGLSELANCLINNIALSYKNFLKADFFQEFKKIKTNKSNLNSIFNRISSDLDLRMVDLNYGSFEIGLAIDKIMKNSISDNEIKKWAIEVGSKYKEIVLDDNYNDESVNKIIDSYTEEDRKKIFHPIFKITENPNFIFQVKDSSNSKYKTIKVTDKKIIDQIIPTNIELTEEKQLKEYQIVQITTVLDKNNSGKTIRLEDSLFSSSNNTDVILLNKDFEKYGYEVNFEISIPLHITAEAGSIKFSANYNGINFQVNNSSDKIDEGIMKITSKIFEYIKNIEE